MKRLQNKIAESGLLLPSIAMHSVAVWLLAGLATCSWWPQVVCFALSAYLMVELNNAYALLRVRSRMVSSVFMALTCTMTFLFHSLTGGLVQLFTIASLLLLLSTYQNKQSLGRIFYAFLLLGIVSMMSVQTLLLVPLLWVLMGTQLQSLSWRGLMATLIGLATPYWFVCVWFAYQLDFTPLADHFSSIVIFEPLPTAYATLTVGHWLTFILTTVLTVTGVIHFLNNSIDDKIRTRLNYGLFTWLSAACLLFTVIQPQHFDPLMRIAVVCTSPIVAHFLTLTSSRITNIAFFVIAGVTLAVTIANLLVI